MTHKAYLVPEEVLDRISLTLAGIAVSMNGGQSALVDIRECYDLFHIIDDNKADWEMTTLDTPEAAAEAALEDALDYGDVASARHAEEGE